MANADGVLVTIITWVLLFISSLAILIRLLSKWVVSRKFHVDDGLAIAALLCSIGAGVAVTVQDANGLAESVESLTDTQKEIFGKSGYAANLLFIASLCFAKLSAIYLFRLVTHQKKHRLLGVSLGVFIALWSIASFITTAYTCQAPIAWNVLSLSCYNKADFWYAFGIINIVTDIALVLLLAYILISLRMSKRPIVLSCFCIRLIDVVATAAQLSYTSAFNSLDDTRALWPWVLITQIVQCITIITSCVPYIRPLMDAFPSGTFTCNNIPPANESTADHANTPEGGHILRPINSTSTASTALKEKSPKATLSSPQTRPNVETSATPAVSVVRNGHMENSMGLQSEEFAS